MSNIDKSIESCAACDYIKQCIQDMHNGNPSCVKYRGKNKKEPIRDSNANRNL